MISSLDSDGFTVGTDARVNSNGVAYHYVAWNETAGEFDVGIYTGDAVDNRSITGVGFQPEYVIIKDDTNKRAGAHSQSMGDATDEVAYFTNNTNQRIGSRRWKATASSSAGLLRQTATASGTSTLRGGSRRRRRSATSLIRSPTRTRPRRRLPSR